MPSPDEQDAHESASPWIGVDSRCGELNTTPAKLALDGAGEAGATMSAMVCLRLFSSFPAVLKLGAGAIVLLTGASCRNMSENADEAWRWLDPVGHRRFHREKYYPNERRVGLRLPDPDED